MVSWRFLYVAMHVRKKVWWTFFELPGIGSKRFGEPFLSIDRAGREEEMVWDFYL